MVRLAALFVVLALPAAAQSTVKVEDAPFAAAGTLAGEIAPEEGAGLAVDEIDPSEFNGARVIDRSGRRIGGLTGIMTDDDDTVTGLVFEVNGVMGFFDTLRLLSPASVTIDRAGENEDGDLRIWIGMSEDELAALPEYVEPGDS